MNINKLKLEVKNVLTKERYEHTLRVLKTAESLSEVHNLNKTKAKIAAIFHDYAKCMELEKMRKLIKKHLSKNLLNENPALWHGPVAAYLLEEKFSIYDSDILNAVKYHTTGREGMSDLEKLIFVSDYIEPKRNFPFLDCIRKEAKNDLTKASFLIAKNTLSYLLENNQYVSPLSLDTYNDLQRQVIGGV